MKNVIGVLLPQSNQYRSIGKDFVRGLKLATENYDVEYKIEGVGFAEDPKKLVDAAQKLINQEDLLLTTGMLGHRGIDELSSFMDESREILLFSDMGATVPYGLQTYDHVFCNSFDLTGSVYALGKYLEESNVGEIGVSTCYYDAGYGFIDALSRSIAENGKTNFSGHFVTPLEPRPNEADLMKEFVDATQPQAIFAAYNGVFAEEHLEFMKESGANKNVPYYATPFSFNQEMRENGEALNGVSLISSWSEELDNKSNEEFIHSFKETYGSAPSEFAVLGYENGLIIRHIIEQRQSGSKSKTNEIIKKCSIDGPRGLISFDQTTNRTEHEHYIIPLNYKENAEGNSSKIHTLPSVQKKYLDEVQKTEPPKNMGGWFNAYLCH
ncbi:MAG: ABC transporter substrate-binding protein [bacterium]|nr:ABC transporter substrate-binding protein [bacterium]